MTRSNFQESAQELITANDILTILFCVLLYVHMYKMHNILQHFVVAVIFLTNSFVRDMFKQQ